MTRDRDDALGCYCKTRAAQLRASSVEAGAIGLQRRGHFRDELVGRA